MSQTRRLTVLLGLNVAMVAGLVIVGLRAHSLGVLAAGGDTVADSAAILLGSLRWLSEIAALSGRRQPRWWPRSMRRRSRSPTSARDVILEAIRRLVTGTDPVQGLPVLVVSSIAAGVMVVGTVILGADAGSEDLHMRSVLLDTVSDAVTSAAVAGTGAIIYLTHGWFWLDPVISIVIGVVIGYGAVRLLGDVIAAVRTRTPLQVSDD